MVAADAWQLLQWGMDGLQIVAAAQVGWVTDGGNCHSWVHRGWGSCHIGVHL